jgi:hypothetical protein
MADKAGVVLGDIDTTGCRWAEPRHPRQAAAAADRRREVQYGPQVAVGALLLCTN